MRAASLIALCLAPAAVALAEGTGGAADHAALRACIAETEAASEDPVFHHCTAALAEGCGAAATAAEAAACIAAARDGLEGAIAAGRADLVAARAAEVETIDWYLDQTRANGEAACVSMVEGQAAAGVAVGQRAVNAAFCDLIVTGDVFVALTRLERAD